MVGADYSTLCESLNKKEWGWNVGEVVFVPCPSLEIFAVGFEM